MGMKEYYAEVQRQATESTSPAQEAPKQESLGSEMYDAFRVGLVGQGAKSLGALGQALSPVGSSFYEAAKDLRSVGEFTLQDPDYQVSEKNSTGLRGLATSGASGVGQMAPILATGLVAGPVAAASTGAALYGGSTYQETKEKGLAKYGLDDAYAAAHPEDPRVQEAKQVGAMSGAIQGGGEFAMDMLGGKLIKGVVPSLFKKSATEVAQSYVKPKTLQNFLKAWGVGAVAEGATEAIQDESQAAVERAYNLPNTPKFGEQAGESFEGGFATALALGPLAAYGTRANSKFKTQQASLLANPEADQNERMRAAALIGSDIAKNDPNAAMIFIQRAEDAIRNPRPYALALDESVFTPLSELKKMQDAEAAKAQEPVTVEAATYTPTPEQAAIDQAWEQEAQRIGEIQDFDRAVAAGEAIPGAPSFRGLAATPQAQPATDNLGRLLAEERADFAPSEYSRFGEMQTQSPDLRQGTEPQLRGQAATPQAQPATDRVSQMKQEIADAAPRLTPTVSSTALPEVSTVTQDVRDAGSRVGVVIDAARAAGVTTSQDLVKLAKEMGTPVRQLSADIKTLGLSKPSDLLRLEVQNAVDQERGAELQGAVPQEQAVEAAPQQRADSGNSVEQAAKKIDGRQALVDRRKVVKSILDAHAEGTDVLTAEEFEGYTSEYEDLRREITGFNDRFARSEPAQGAGVKATQVQKWLGNIPNVIVLDDFTELFANEKDQNAEAVARRSTGKIYVNASKMKSAQHAKDIVFDHELRHFGLSKMFGGATSLAKEMEKAFKGREAEVIAFAMQRGYTRSVAEATEEYIVSKAKEAKEQGFLGRVVAGIRGWARANGFGSLGYSNAEILKMIRESGEVVGVGSDVSGDDRFSRPETKQEIDAIFTIANEQFKTPVTKAKRPKGGIHIERLADLFGKPVVWYDSDENFRGFGAPGGRTIFLNADSRNPVLQVLGHELSHKLYRDDPAAYAALEKYTLARTDKGDFDEYTSLMTDRALAKVEFVGDVVGGAFAKKEFWKEFEAKEPTLFARVLSAVRAVLKRAADFASNFSDAGAIVAEINAVDKMIAQTFAQYAKDQQTDRFSRGDRNDFTTRVLEEARRADKGGDVTTPDSVASGISGAEFDDRATTGARVGAQEAGSGVQQTIGGENEAERLRSEARAAELSVPFQAAFEVYRGNGGSSRENLEALKRYASEKGLIVDGVKFYGEWEKGKKIHGGENTVLFKDGYAEKLNDLGYHKGDIGAFLQRMAAHNEFFPSAAYELMGFVKQGERLLPMTKQKFVAAATDVKTSLTQIEKELTERGFKLIDREGGMWLTPDGKFEMFDAGRSNVITDAEGNLHFIDAVFLPVGGVEDRFARPFNKQEAIDEIKSYGPSLKRFLQKFISWIQPLNRRYDSLQYTEYLTDDIKAVVRDMAEQSGMQRSEQNRVLSTTKEATDQWMKAGKDGNDLFESMALAQDASLLQLYPGKSMVEQGWGDTPEAARKAWNKAVGVKYGRDFATEYSRLTKEFNALSPATRKAYLGAVDVMANLREQLTASYMNMIETMPIEEAKKRTMRTGVERRFRNLKGAFMPFTRHGEYVANVYNKADGKVVNSTRAASMGELRAQVELLKAQYPADQYDIRKFDGRVIHKAKENRISPALLAQMKEMLVDNLNQAGFSKVHKLAKKFLEENVEQLSDDQRDLVKAIYKAGNLKSQAAAINALRDNVIDSYELVDLMNTMDSARDTLKDNPGLTKAIDDLEQIFLDTLPDTSALKSSMHRKGTAGWNRDSIRSVLDYANRYGKSLAYMKHGRLVDQLEAQASKMAEAIPDPEKSLTAQTVLKDTFENRRVVSEEEVGALGKMSTKLGSLWFLTSPSMMLVQNSQPWAITMPYLAARYGLKAAVDAMFRNHVSYQFGQKFTDDKINTFDADLKRAPKDWNTNLPFSLSRFYASANGETKAKILKSLTAEEKDMLALRLGMDSGVIANSMSFEAVEYARKGASGQIGTALDTAAEKAYYFQRVGETLSRKGAYMAAFELATKNGDSFDEANRKAIHAVNETLYDYSATNRPRIISGTFGRFFGQFRTYQLQTLGHIANLGMRMARGDAMAKKELGLLLATNFVLAGATGLPLAGSIATLLGALGFLMGEDDEWVKEIEEEMMKTKVGQVALKGAPMLLGLDLSRRIGMEGLTKVFQGDAPAKATPKDRMNFYAAQILGPAYTATAGAVFNMDQAIQDGDWGKAFEQGTPRAIASALQAMKLNNKGLTDSSGRVIIPEDQISKWDVALMMVGVNPGHVSIAREKERNVRDVTDMMDLKKQRLAKDLERAVMDSDGAGLEKAQAAIQRFNQQYPMFGFTSQSLASRLRGAWQERAGVKSKKYQAAEMYLDRDEEDEEA